MKTRTAPEGVQPLRKHEPKLTSEYAADPSLIEEGMGVTYRTALGGFYSSYTVIEVRRGGKELVVQEDIHVPGPEYSWSGNTSDEEYYPNPEGKTETITFRKNGYWIAKGAPMERHSSLYVPGYRRDWIDYSQ